MNDSNVSENWHIFGVVIDALEGNIVFKAQEVVEGKYHRMWSKSNAQ